MGVVVVLPTVSGLLNKNIHFGGKKKKKSTDHLSQEKGT